MLYSDLADVEKIHLTVVKALGLSWKSEKFRSVLAKQAAKRPFPLFKRGTAATMSCLLPFFVNSNTQTQAGGGAEEDLNFFAAPDGLVR
jgi:hypothetical protein